MDSRGDNAGSGARPKGEKTSGERELLELFSDLEFSGQEIRQEKKRYTHGTDDGVLTFNKGGGGGDADGVSSGIILCPGPSRPSRSSIGGEISPTPLDGRNKNENE